MRIIAGKTVLERVIARIGTQCDGLILNANGAPAGFAEFDLPVIADSVVDFPGPLAGVLAGLDWVAKGRCRRFYVSKLARFLAAATIFVLAGNTLLRPLLNAIDCIPLNEGASEATYEIIVTTNSERAAEVREKLAETLEKASYPIRETKVIYRSDDNVEVAAELVTLAAKPDELDGVVAALAALPSVSHAAWNVSAME
jgi:hypothetical protein